MMELPKILLTLAEARDLVSERFEIPPKEAEEYLEKIVKYEEIKLRNLETGVRVSEVDGFTLDFTNSKISRNKGLHAITIMDQKLTIVPETHEVGIKRKELENYIGKQGENPEPLAQSSAERSTNMEYGCGKLMVVVAAEKLKAEGDPGGQGFAKRIHEAMGAPPSPNLETVKRYVRVHELDN